MFALECREVGKETWREMYRGASLTATTVKDNISHKPEFIGINGKGCEWRIREIDEVGEKSLSSG